MTAPILQDGLPYALPWTDPATARLPGVQPCALEDWLLQDAVYGAQMAERDRLFATDRAAVHALTPAGLPAARELLDTLLDWLAARPGHAVTAAQVVRPDGVVVPVDRDDPLATAGRLVQQDLCLLQQAGDGDSVLTGAALCFPASWTLAEKIGQPMTRIHAPVPEYDAGIAARVQRMMAALRPGVILWRTNFNVYAVPALHHPRPEAAPRIPGARNFLRSERQTFRRLPATGAVVFAIHTFVIPMDRLSPAAREGLAAAGR
jgi:hypothetical protein